MPLFEIQQIMKQHEEDQSKRIAQHKLAAEFVELVHGQAAAEKAQQQHSQAFSKSLTVEEIREQAEISKLAASVSSLQDEHQQDMHPSLNKYAKPQDMHSSADVHVKLPQSLVNGQPLTCILWSAGLVASRGEGRRLVDNGGVYIGGTVAKRGLEEMRDKIEYIKATRTGWDYVQQFIIDSSLLVLRTGKWKKKFITIVPDQEFEAQNLTCPGWEKGVEAQSSSNEMDGSMQKYTPVTSSS